jgi:tetratricopeptide (TPR) repeat protein
MRDFEIKKTSQENSDIIFNEKLSSYNLNSPELFEIDSIENQLQMQRNRSMFKKAQQYIQSSFYDNAIDILRQLQEYNPKESKFHSYIGLALLKKGWTKPAQLEFKNALALNPNDPLALENLLPNPESGGQQAKTTIKGQNAAFLPRKRGSDIISNQGFISKITQFFL